MTEPSSSCNCRLEVLRMLRIMRGMSLKQLAEATEGIVDATGNKKAISAAYIHQLETGKIDTPSPHNLFKLSEALQFPYARLMELAGYAYGGVPDDSVQTDDTDVDQPAPDRFGALAEAIAEADIPLEGKELLTGAVREYELCFKAGVEPPRDLLGHVLREYQRIHEAGMEITLADITPGNQLAA